MKTFEHKYPIYDHPVVGKRKKIVPRVVEISVAAISLFALYLATVQVMWTCF